MALWQEKSNLVEPTEEASEKRKRSIVSPELDMNMWQSVDEMS